MCEPMSMMAIASVAMTVIGAATQAQAQKAEGKRAAQMAEYNNALALNEYAAKQAMQQREADLFRRRSERVKGAQRLALASSGVDLDSGTPLLLQEETAGELELDALMLEHGADLTAFSARQSQASTAFEVQNIKAGAKAKSQATLLQGAASAGSRAYAGGAFG